MIDIMKTSYLISLFLIYGTLQSVAQTSNDESLTDSTFYAFAFFIGDQETLLLTEINSIEISLKSTLTENAQKHLFLRDNNVNFLKYIRKNYPGHASMIRPKMNTIYISKYQAEAEQDREFKLNGTGNNHIVIYDFEFTQLRNAKKPAQMDIY